jgi:hypothetical protein
MKFPVSVVELFVPFLILQGVRETHTGTLSMHLSCTYKKARERKKERKKERIGEKKISNKN